MAEDQLLELIKVAIQMENDAQAFYSKNAAKIPTEIGRTMFKRFAKDESIHLDTFKKIFKRAVGHTELITIMNARKKYIDLPIFPKDLKEIDWANPNRYELEGLHTAMDAEMEAIKYYLRVKDSTEDQLIIEILDEIIKHEKKHHEILHWQYMYLSQTGQWEEIAYYEEK